MAYDIPQRVTRLEHLYKELSKDFTIFSGSSNAGGGGNGNSGSTELFTLNSPTIGFRGTGTELDPLAADSLVAPIQNGIISGGEVTWITDYTYSVSPAFYYINGNPYNSLYTEITLDAADLLLNRIDLFVLTTSGTAEKITGTASANPEQPSINTSTQLQASFALVTANTTSPVGLSQEYIYRENTGVPTEWAATGTGGIVVNSIANPSAGVTSIEGTSVVAGNSLTLIDSAASAVGATKNVLIFYIRSKASWNNNRRLNFQFRNGVTNVGLSVPLGNGLFGFDSTITASYQRIVIPLSEFSVVPADNIDRLVVTASGTGGTLGFYIDDIELQGANIPAAPTGTTDNVGVFYVNRNFSGIAAAAVTGFTIATITSTNGGYNTQLMSARMGDMNKAYPCPWSARNAAMTAMASGQITKAYIRVIGPSTYTVGSDVAANNGPAAGGATTATVADIGFSSPNRTAIASLMKHNIFYHFEENTMLTHINRTYAINSGCYNVDAADVTFVSGIYGKGIFHHVYGNGNGTISNFSQRFIEVDNTRCSIDFECHEAAFQRASFFIFSHKRINIKATNYFCDSESFVVAVQGSTDANEGDGLPMTINFESKNTYKGNIFYPYPLTGSVTVSQRPMFALDVITATRQKNVSIKMENLFVNGCDLQEIYASFLGGINRTCINYSMTMEIDNLFQTTDSVRQALLVANPNSLIGIGGGTANHIRENYHETFIIKNAVIDASLFRFSDIKHSVAGNKNNSVTLKLGKITRRIKNAVSADYVIGLPIPAGAGGVTNAVVGERPVVTISAESVVAETGKVFSEAYALGVPVYVGATTITGTFIAKDGSPVIMLTGTGNMGVLKDCVLIAKGAATNAIEVNNGGNPVNIYTKDTVANLPYEAGITQEGILNVDPDIANYF
jgi:hypothetical protein